MNNRAQMVFGRLANTDLVGSDTSSPIGYGQRWWTRTPSETYAHGIVWGQTPIFLFKIGIDILRIYLKTSH